MRSPLRSPAQVEGPQEGLDLKDRVPDELWMEVCDIVQETRIKTIPKKKKCNKAKWLSEEALQIAKFDILAKPGKLLPWN